MGGARGLTAGFALVLGLLVACDDGRGRGDARVDDVAVDWSTPVTTVSAPTGHTVALRTGPPGCWRVSEVRSDGTETGAVSACHGLPATAASRVLGVVVVVTGCSGAPSVAVGDAAQWTVVEDVSDGIFLVPPGLLPADAPALTYACRTATGEDGSPVTVDVAG
ncbi:hypothetical protein GA0070622_2473 [Micromonospora sediminicola]|uniref:Lipoprotein n=1 Tax=Micromonospora sediminicola TaxID=946078 RepID=A0A1A9B8L8_9ACTN|nr:hypothetical protein [Micromonospora sediminicola]SBT65478.1 hypothetical protein GA0070622_2473 [Micromonospora sediminicola]